MPPDDKKLEELILLLATRSRDDRSFGVTKLNKLLFFCDFLAFRAWAQSITGHRYQKLPYGPAPVAVVPVLRRMVRDGSCQVVERVYCGMPQKTVVALRDPDDDVFLGHELRLIDDVIEEYRFSNGSEVSELSHQFIGWKASELNEEIPYETVFVDGPRPLTQEEISVLEAAAAAG
jgi:hypothetical protein